CGRCGGDQQRRQRGATEAPSLAKCRLAQCPGRTPLHHRPPAIGACRRPRAHPTPLFRALREPRQTSGTSKLCTTEAAGHFARRYIRLTAQSGMRHLRHAAVFRKAEMTCADRCRPVTVAGNPQCSRIVEQPTWKRIMTRRWKRRPEGSNWGEFGDDDQLGSLNYIDAAAVLRAAREIGEGRSFCLSLPLDYPGGRSLAPIRFPPTLKPTDRDGTPVFNQQARFRTHMFCDVVCDDQVLMCTQYSTQWDSFAHVGSIFDLNDDGKEVPCFYNGYRAGLDVVPPEMRGDDYTMTLGIDRFAVKAIQSRGVMVDLEKHFGRAEKSVTFEEMQNVMIHDGVTVEAGDMVCIHTGFGAELLKM